MVQLLSLLLCYLIAELTALENVLLPTWKDKKIDSQKDFAKDLLAQFGLKEKSDRLPSQLSGGEQQRVAIARALVMRTNFLFADEPTGPLDTANGENVLVILKDINRNFMTTVIMVTYDLDYAASADRMIELRDGMIV